MEREDLLDDDWDDNPWQWVVAAAAQVDEQALRMVTCVVHGDGDFHLAVDGEALWTWSVIGDHHRLGPDFSVDFCYVGGGHGGLQRRAYGTCDWEVLAVVKVHHRDLVAVEDGPSCGPTGFDLEDLRLVFSTQTVLDLQCLSEVEYCRAECADVCPSVECR